MASVEDIWNVASSLLGIASVADKDESSRSASIYRSVWDITRRRFIGMHSWNGTTRTLQLASTGSDPVTNGGFRRAFTLPEAVITVFDVNPYGNSAGSEVWRVEAGVLLTNSVAAVARVAYDVGDDTSVFRAEAARALGYLLASEVATAVGKTMQERMAYEELAMKAISEAKQVDGQESSPIPFEDESIINARY